MPEVTGEDLLQQDRQRPAVDHHVVEREDEPMLVPLRADQCRAQRRPIGEVADGGTLGSAQMLNLFIGSQVVTAKIEVPPRDHRISQNHLYWITELCAEARGKIGMTAHHGVYRVAEPKLVDKTRHGDVELHCVEVDSGLIAFERSRSARECGVEKQTFLYGCQRQYVDNLVLLVQLIDLLLAQLSGSDIGRGQSTAATADVRADAGQGLEPQLTQPLHLWFGDRRGCPRPTGAQMWAGLLTEAALHNARIEVHRVHQRHGHRRGNARRREAVLVDAPQVIGEVGGTGTEAAQVVEADGRFRSGQIHVRIQVAQQSVSQRIGKSPQLFFGALDDWA
ncbi:Uncharacterised protein [Mycobacteroides abscessus]|nr:Uncharacterised protein [Mycobacteroides abscessus]SIE91702.1 Uncharacterised protein [Mycobacteroides abscessus subsp. abscessus]SIH86486.1 Uncharacterised protein [Mycobacteroides abscessus subsp. abscessus]SIK65726.1 Uncharacterised protein [Mycobacteroides abscessus subsp. abscessus]